MLKIGLTGGIGSGKSAVAKRFAELGAAIIDTDQIAHTLTAQNGLAIPAIRHRFGGAYITPTGMLDRPKMRERVFADRTARQELEAILHPLIRQEAERCSQAASHHLYQIFVVPLLAECPTWQSMVQRILVVDCALTTQIQRVVARSQLTVPQVEAIIATQANRTQRLQIADDVLLNAGSLIDLHRQVDTLHHKYVTDLNSDQ